MAEPTRERILEAARSLIPVLRERAPEAERIRRIPDETIDDLRGAGLWDILKPERYGGVETDYGVMIDVTIELGRGCAATSWVYINIVAHNWMLPYWPDGAEEEIWGENPEALIGSTLVFPAGKLAPADGGYMLTGRWPYASGVDSSDWMMLGAIGRGPDDEAPGPRIVLVRASDIEIIDTWHVSGLVGTGSKDVACDDLFVPDHMVLDMAPAQEGYPPETEGMSDAYRLPLLPIIPHLVAAPMIGAAQAAYDDYTAFLRDQVSTYNRSRVAEHVTVQLKLAEAAQMVDIARLLVREDWMEAHALIAKGAPFPLIDRARWRRNGAYAAGCCVKAVDLIHSVCGARANYRDNALQRQHRDVHAAKHQIHLSWEINGAEFGRVAAGLKPNNALL